MVFNKSDKDMYFDSRKSTVFIIVLISIILIYALNTIAPQCMNKIHIALNKNKASALNSNINKENKYVKTETEEVEEIPVMKIVKPKSNTDVEKSVATTSSNDSATNITNNSTNSVSETEKIKPASGFKEIFKNDVFLGDSITKGLVTYNFLGERNVHAKIGISTLRVNDMVDEAVVLKPENVFILCGINDMDETLNKERFTKHYMQLVRNVKAKLPEAKVYVQSILPISANAEENPPYVKNYQINEYNAVIKKIAQSENVNYLNIALLLEDKNLFEGDGIHFKAAFYPLWLNYLKDNVK